MVAFITGGSRGIGKATAEYFKNKGSQVIAPTRAELDLSDKQSVKAYLTRLENTPIDTIINNAGINDINCLEDVSDDEMERMLQIDLIAPILLLRGLIPNLKMSQIGRIVNIGSIWAVVSKKGRAMYSAAKNGMHGITNSLALELGEYGILVNTVCPGFTLTELTRQNNTPKQIDEISQQIPLKRMAQPEEIARFIYFLGSYENTYITGQKISIDGGFCAQ